MQRLSKQRFLDVVPIQKVMRSLPGCVTLVVNRAMMLDPARRYQAPSVMLNDLRIAEKRLAENPSQPEEEAAAEAESSDQSSPAIPYIPSNGRVVMVVESDAQMQDIFRDAFKRAGYRVLIISDPARALGRCLQDAATADCVIFDAQLLAQSALDAFNQLAAQAETRSIPAVLIVAESQGDLKSQAVTSDRRLVLTMPITMKQLQETLARLVPPKTKTVSSGW